MRHRGGRKIVVALAGIGGLCALLFGMACDDNDPMHDIPTSEEVPSIILDTDIGASCDDLFAWQLLYHYVDQKQCDLLGIVVDRPGSQYAELADMMNTYFGLLTVPIGWVRQGVEGTPIYTDYSPLPQLTDANGNPLFQRSVPDVNQLPEGYVLYRQLLAQAADHSVMLCCIGFTTALAQLLTSVGDAYSPLTGVELVQQKVRSLHIMGGTFNQEAPATDYNFGEAMDDAHTFFRLWPSSVDVIFSPSEVGDAIYYRPEDVLSDLSSIPIHPIKQVYQQWEWDPDQRLWDCLVILSAMEGESLFHLSERGHVSLHEGGLLSLTPNPTGNCRYQLPGDSTWVAQILQMIRNMIKAVPAP